MGYKNRLRNIVDMYHFPLWGILGCLSGLVTVLLPTQVYIGRFGESYSPLNHYLSELGEIGISDLAAVFNVGLMIIGVLWIPFMIGLGLYLENNIGKIAAVVGVYSLVSIFLVGVFPMNDRLGHEITSTSFYLSGLIMSGLWAIAIFMQHKPKIPKIFSIGGIINVAIFLLFLYGPWELMSIMWDRPAFSIRTTLEWGIFVGIVGYILSISFYILRKEKGTTILIEDPVSLQE